MVPTLIFTGTEYTIHSIASLISRIANISHGNSIMIDSVELSSNRGELSIPSNLGMINCNSMMTSGEVNRIDSVVCLPCFKSRFAKLSSRQTTLFFWSALYRLYAPIKTVNYPHLLSPQFKQVIQPSIKTNALVWHFAQSKALAGKLPDSSSVDVSLWIASNSLRLAFKNCF